MFMMPVHPPGRPMSETLAEDTAKSLLADKLGYDELWMGEHFSATTEPFPSPLMFLAGLVPQTRNLTFGTAVINLPNHHPAIVAAECAQFDHMSGGRFLMGVGSGGLASDFELFNIDPAARQRQFMESIDMILRIWAQDPPYDIQGEFWNVQIKKAIMPELGVGTMPKPLQGRIRRSTSQFRARTRPRRSSPAPKDGASSPDRLPRRMQSPITGGLTAKRGARQAAAPETKTGVCHA